MIVMESCRMNGIILKLNRGVRLVKNVQNDGEKCGRILNGVE